MEVVGDTDDVKSNNELLEHVGHQTIVGEINVCSINKEYHHEAVLEMWKYAIGTSDVQPDMEIYHMIEPFFKIIMNAKRNITLHIVPNKRHQYAYLLIKIGCFIYGITVENDSITNTLVNAYVQKGLSGNLIALYFSES